MKESVCKGFVSTSACQLRFTRLLTEMSLMSELERIFTINSSGRSVIPLPASLSRHPEESLGHLSEVHDGCHPPFVASRLKVLLEGTVYGCHLFFLRVFLLFFESEPVVELVSSILSSEALAL